MRGLPAAPRTSTIFPDRTELGQCAVCRAPWSLDHSAISDYGGRAICAPPRLSTLPAPMHRPPRPRRMRARVRKQRGAR
eukprot:5031944-Pyramimonas_sp.AAC.1